MKLVRPGTRLPPVAHPKHLFVALIGILRRLSPRAWSHRGLLCNLSLVPALKHTHGSSLYCLAPRLNCQMRRMAKHVIDRVCPWWKDAGFGAKRERRRRSWMRRTWQRRQQRDYLLPFTGADKSCLSSVLECVCRGRWTGLLAQRKAEWHGWREVWLTDRARNGGKESGVRGVETGSVDGVGSPSSPRAPGVAGNSSRHVQAQGQRRLQWSQTATGVNDRRHFSLWRRREKCQWSRGLTYAHTNTHSTRTHIWIHPHRFIRTRFPFIALLILSHGSPHRDCHALSWKIKSNTISLTVKLTHSGADNLFQRKTVK